MKKLRCFLFCLMLSMQAAAGLFPVFRPITVTKAPISICEECPFKDSRQNG